MSIRVLAIDGGSVRAHLAAVLLAELERRAERPADDLFDLVVGTSTGGLIAMGVAVGIPASRLVQFFPRLGERMFGRAAGVAGLEQRLEQSSKALGCARLVQPAPPRHRPEGLEAVLRDVFGAVRLSQVTTPLAVTAFDRAASAPVVLSSRDAASDLQFDLPLVDVGRATTAAGPMFAPLVTQWGEAEHSFADWRGAWANNPAAVALAEAVALAGGDVTGLVMVSLGCGAAPGTAMAALNRSWLGEAQDPATMASTVWTGEVLARRALDPSRFHRFPGGRPPGRRSDGRFESGPAGRARSVRCRPHRRHRGRVGRRCGSVGAV